MEAVLEHGQHKGLCTLSDLRALVGLPSKRSATELSASVQEMFNVATGVLDSVLCRAIEQRTSAEFVAARSIGFDIYWKATTALSGLVEVTLQSRTIDRLVAESFCELEADFRDQGVVRFGAPAKEQAVFTVWTLRKISRILTKIHEAGAVPKSKKTADRKIASEFSFYAAWSQFHLDCLVTSIRKDKSITPEVLDDICEGLRGAVNAYGLARQGLELRVPVEEPTLAPIQWDEEDQELLASSMQDMGSEALSD